MLSALIYGSTLAQSYSNYSNTNSIFIYESFSISQSTSSSANVFFPDLFDNLAKVDAFLNLPKGWNGYDANPISKNLVDNIKYILVCLSKQPEVFPTARNSIQLEYEKPNGDYLEFEVFEDGNIEMFLQKEGSEIEVTISSEEIQQKVEEFYE